MDDDMHVETLGVRLQRAARALISARLVSYPWVEPLSELLEHIASLPGADRRFDRVEAEIYGAGPQQAGASTVTQPQIANAAEPAHDLSATGEPLTSDVHARLRHVVGAEIPMVRVHRDPAADAVARAHRADAVTFGNDIYFRQNRFQPHEPDGFALLAHEATHVAQVPRQKADGQRSTDSGRQEQEAAALFTEIVARSAPQRITGINIPEMSDHGAAPQTAPIAMPRREPRPAGAPAVSATTAIAMSTGPAEGSSVTPMTAASDRELSSAPGGSASVDVEALRRLLIHDLKEQLRTEFERGG